MDNNIIFNKNGDNTDLINISPIHELLSLTLIVIGFIYIVINIIFNLNIESSIGVTGSLGSDIATIGFLSLFISNIYQTNNFYRLIGFISLLLVILIPVRLITGNIILILFEFIFFTLILILFIKYIISKTLNKPKN